MGPDKGYLRRSPLQSAEANGLIMFHHNYKYVQGFKKIPTFSALLPILISVLPFLVSSSAIEGIVSTSLYSDGRQCNEDSSHYSETFICSFKT